MNTIQIPSFIISSNGALVTRRLLEFKKLCSQFADETVKGRDASVKVMKILTDYPPIRGVPVLNNVLELLKDTVFSYQAEKSKVTEPLQNCSVKVNSSGDSADNIPALLAVARRMKSYDTFLSWKALFACKRLHEELLAVCRDHQFVVRQIQEALQNYKVLNEKCIKAGEALQNKSTEFYSRSFQGENQFNFDPAALDVHQKCVHLLNQFNRRKKKSQAAFDKLASLYEKEKTIREENMKKKEDELRSIIETEIRETLSVGIKSLLKVARSTQLPGEFIERLEIFDCHEVAEQLFKDLSGKYFHPVIDATNQDEPIATTAFVYPQFVVMETDEQRFRAHGSYVCLLEEEIFERRREELYVWANNSLDEKNNAAQLKLKIDTKIKQKFCVTDGSLAFGWTRKLACGVKKYGFYPTSATRLVP